MVKHVRRASDVNTPLRAGQHVPLPEGLLARLCAITGMRLTSDGALRASAQLACGAWLAGYRAARGVSEAELVKAVGITVRQLRWVEWGLADPRLLTDEQGERLVRALATDDDAPSLRAVVRLALGQSEPSSSGALQWVVDDLVSEIWSEPVSPIQSAHGVASRRPLLEEALFLKVLELAPRDSHGLLEEVARLNPVWRAAFGKSAAISVLHQVVEAGWVAEIGDAFRQEDNRDIATFRLTPHGRLALQLYRADELDAQDGGPFGVLRFIEALLKKAPLRGSAGAH
jgi:hypothetical protein